MNVARRKSQNNENKCIKQGHVTTLTGNVPLTRLGLPLGYGFPGIIPQDEIIATGALQPTLHT